ncbi:MAG TPA: TonB-dependent receptor [Microvirga sp.]|nr:TonB-dependent receptor [Microvirga sp.]
MSISTCRLLAASVSFCALFVGTAQAQSPEVSTSLPDLVVTATRTPLAISQAGSAISVITAEEIAKESPKSMADVLRRVPGVSVVESGGPGGTTSVRIRGGEARHTLVLIDGIRVNDPSSGSAEFDFANLVATDIERIEVLRGPQSALYGSDAIGGVINVITRKGKGAPRFSTSVEGGSYGTKAARAAVSGSSGPVSYAFSTTGFDAAGFSRYGYRIGRIENTRLLPLEADNVQKLGASGRAAVALSPDVELEVGGYGSFNGAQYDAAFGDLPDSPSQSQQRLFEGHTRLTAYALDGLLRNSVLVSASRTSRHYRDVSSFGLPALSWSNTDFTGDRVAAEYQGDLKLGPFGLLSFGAKVERERITAMARDILPFATPERETNDASQTTRSLFALHQFTLFENLHLSLGGRLDDIEDGDRFGTWRATAAYEIPDTGMKIRGSVGTGAKAPSLYQLFDPAFGNPALESERSVGFDVGVDQRLLDDRLLLSATFFANRFRNLIDFATSDECRPDQIFGCFVNVARATTSGVELSAEVDLVPSWLRIRAAYTHLEAIDRQTDLRLARRPRDEGRLGLILTPMTGLSIEPSVTFVGSRFSSTGEQLKLQPYARFDVYADYKIDDTFSVFARAENLTDARYQEVFDYGTAGRSFYAGLRATW